jgi:peptidoglycan/xylan/chitin deacetylase (PgdA/CDA1 family)
MNADLYARNTPAAFWKLQLDQAPGEADWAAAVGAASGWLPKAAGGGCRDIGQILGKTLGEEQFGTDHWSLSLPRRAYYEVKPLLSRPMITTLRRWARPRAQRGHPLGWPVEPRYAEFQWALAEQLLLQRGLGEAEFIHFWPQARRFALVLTHDIETAAGQAFAGRLADLEESLGFRSSFNFVPEEYPLDRGLMDDLRRRGFEIGVHGCKHDGKLFRSRPEFERAAERINHYLREFGAAGFRSPLTHRHPAWMQALEVEYDLSFFDTDPFEPMPGGTMSLWPFALGRFIELPYTLPQDSTLLMVMGEKTPRLWLAKVDFIAHYHGMALVNTHPDYLRAPDNLAVYAQFLRALRERQDYWHALPREAAAWWRRRMAAAAPARLPGATLGRLRLAPGTVQASGAPAARPRPLRQPERAAA